MNYTVPMNSSLAYQLRPGLAGFSREAVFVASEKQSLAGRLMETVTFGERDRAILSRLFSVISQTANEGWDGYGALPVSVKTYIKTMEFLCVLPGTVKLPEMSADPDGSLSMEWYRSPEWIVSISIDGNGKLDYAAIFGDRKYHGSMYFADEIDKEVLNHIGRV